MARSRNIKPSFFTNEQLADNSPLGRLLFIGLWTMADFKGDLEWKEKTLKIQLLPWDNCDLKELAINLDSSGLIRFYSSQEKTYINIPNFERHQNPHKNEKLKGSDIPRYSDELRQAFDLKGIKINRDKNGTNRDENATHPADSLLLIPDSPILNPSTPKPQKPAQAPMDTKVKTPDYPDWFEEIWKHYPTRAGGDNKKIAFQKANARVNEGKTTDELYSAVDRYKYFVVATGKVSTEYVKQAATFFGSIDNIVNPWAVPNSTGVNHGTNKQANGSGSRFGGLAHDDTSWADGLFPEEQEPVDRFDQQGVQIIEGDFSRLGGSS
jgi:hypothetical protein